MLSRPIQHKAAHFDKELDIIFLFPFHVNELMKMELQSVYSTNK